MDTPWVLFVLVVLVWVVILVIPVGGDDYDD